MQSRVRGWNLEDYADDIAILALETVWQRVVHRVGMMSLAEARGYIRARGGIVISRETDNLVARMGELGAHRLQILEMASDLLIDRLERRVFEAQRSALPRRRAA